MEWPLRSGRTAEFPEVDRIQFFTLAEAKTRINPAQQPFLDRLADF
jgi:predicted NUDIX family NTP pyrophosphohydrolase